MLTIRGNWITKRQRLLVPHTGTPAFAEVSGSLIFTDLDEYTAFVNQKSDYIEALVENLHCACSQNAELVAQFDNELPLSKGKN